MAFFRTSDGAEISYQAGGSGPPLVLVPGIGAGGSIWGPFPKALGRCVFTISYDPRGIGQSKVPEGSPAERTTIRRMALDIREMIEHLGVGRAHILGVSLGGIVAQYLAAEFPGCVDRLVLVATAGRMDAWTRRLVRIFEIMVDRLSPSEYAEVVTPLIASPAFFRNEPIKVADLEARLAYEPGSKGIIHAQIDALRGLDGGGPAIGVPTLVIGGSQDVITPASCSEALSRRIPGSRLLILEGGHSCLMERAEEGLVAILAFLRPEGGR